MLQSCDTESPNFLIASVLLQLECIIVKTVLGKISSMSFHVLITLVCRKTCKHALKQFVDMITMKG